MTTFSEAMDLLCLSASDVADMFGVGQQTVRQMRMDPDARGARTPPDGWQKVFAKLADQRGKRLAALAKELRSI